MKFYRPQKSNLFDGLLDYVGDKLHFNENIDHMCEKKGPKSAQIIFPMN